MANKVLIGLRCCICGRKSTTSDYRNRYAVRETPAGLRAWQICSDACLTEANHGYMVTPADYEFKAAARGFALC